MRILIAEDSLVSRRLLESTLTRWGHEVIATSDGDEAWRVLQAGERPALAILDWMMPGMDGLELCRRIREMPDLSPLYVILLTAKGTRDEVLDGCNAGINDYLVKPLDSLQLQLRLEEACRAIEAQQRLVARAGVLEEGLSNHSKRDRTCAS